MTFIFQHSWHHVDCRLILAKMTTAGLEPATFWYRKAIEAKRATIALGSHVVLFLLQAYCSTSAIG